MLSLYPPVLYPFLNNVSKGLYKSPSSTSFFFALVFNTFLKLLFIGSSLKSPKTKIQILVLGDFNDDPINSSFKKVLKTKAKKKDVEDGDLYNPFETLFKKGYNTGGYRDNISMFDQILITSALLNKEEKDFSRKIFFLLI